MSILQTIRKFLKLDDKVLSIDPQIIIWTGIYMNEPPMIPQREFDQCLTSEQLPPFSAIQIHDLHINHDSPFIHA